MGLDYFRYYSAWNDHANRRRYAAPADPWQLIAVDPRDIDEWTMVSLKWGLGRVRGGDWDREDRRRLDETQLYQGLEERFLDEKPWEETAYYEWGREKLDDADSFRGCESIDEFVEKRCGGLDELVAAIRENGYSPNYERLYDSPADIEYIHEMEPIVVLDRDGEILLTEGYHRVMLSQLLGVDSIPAYVLRRHEQWQAIREETHERRRVPADSVAESDHPDLQDVLESGDSLCPFDT